MGKLINRIPGSRLLISSLPSSASQAISTSILKAMPGILDIKRHSPSILYLLILNCFKIIPEELKSQLIYTQR